jgi:hypothetical protein
MEKSSKAELEKTAKEVMKAHNVVSIIATDDDNYFLPNSSGISAAREHGRAVKSELYVFGEPIKELDRVAANADADQVVAGNASATAVNDAKDAHDAAAVIARKEVLIRIEQLAQEGNKVPAIKKQLIKEKYDAALIEEMLNAQASHS